VLDRLIVTVSLWIVLGLGGAMHRVAFAAVPLAQVQVSAAEFTPGQPLRITVRAATPIASIRGKLFDHELSFLADTNDPACWWAWGVIPLQAKSGAIEQPLAVSLVSGQSGAATLRFQVKAKKFPTERLTVNKKYVEPPADVQARLERERELLAEVYKRRTPAARSSKRFLRPVSGAETSEFGKQRYFNGELRDPHPGIDLRAATGTPVKAASDGVVALARDLYYSGLTVIVDHGAGLFTVYAHLSQLQVEPDQQVAAGELIGLSGATGRVTGPHLHWGAKLGQIVFDPRALLVDRLFE
jgi:murein DD-endopeptidase MepM/ murein hydrolase activator NlpD